MKNYPDNLTDISDIPLGTHLRDWTDGEIRIIVGRGGFSMCVYLGIPEDHPLAGRDYDDLPIDCHGGLTYSDKGDGAYLPEGWWWFGYDYGHAGDYVWYSNNFRPAWAETDHKWRLDEIVSETSIPLADLKRLMQENL